MYGKNITSKIQQKYIDDYLESSKIVNYTDMDKIGGAFTVLYKDLPKREIIGYPFASDYVSKEGMTYTVDDFLHCPKANVKIATCAFTSHHIRMNCIAEQPEAEKRPAALNRNSALYPAKRISPTYL